jgi:hypothetical protein
MFDCKKCVNKKNCKENIRYTEDLKKDMANLSQKYKYFYGRINVDCDYFIDDSPEEYYMQVQWLKKHKEIFHRYKQISNWEYDHTDGQTSMRIFKALFKCEKIKYKYRVSA